MSLPQMTDQTTLRQRLKQQRRTLPAEAAARSQARILASLQSHPWFRRARNIAAYFGSNGEIDPMPLLNRIDDPRKKLYLPVLHPLRHGQLWFCHWRPGDRLHNNRFGIPEPLPGGRCLIPARQLDLVIVPLLGFDDHCNRLGMGGGYYDRTFAFRKRHPHITRPRLLGLAHAFQRVEQLPTQPWDVALDGVISEKGVFSRQR
ncbi:MAG: 5-formyltetrahydrofolate cyclo-ligase [Gammaproteobacteria bacterium]|nr:5-formyltetrahydrofolate cyclo-ligase [Gammaproteobacteria bacterium]